MRDPSGPQPDMEALRAIERLHWALAAAGCALFWVTGNTAVAAGTLAGAGLIWGNVWLFRHLFSSLVRRRPQRRRLAISLLFAKLPLLWGLLWVAAGSRLVALDGFGLAAGITCFPLAVVLIAVKRQQARA